MAHKQLAPTVAVKIRHLYISPGHNYFGHHDQPPGEHPTVEIAEIKCLAGRGIAGDRFFDFKNNYKGQITFFAWETYEALCRELGIDDKSPSVFRRNVITCGIDLNDFIGSEFEVQNVTFGGMEECRPCHWMETAFGFGAEKLLRGKGGLRAQILTSGIIRVDTA